MAGRAPRAAAKALREAQKPQFKLDDTGALVPDIRAEAAIIYNPETGQVLWESQLAEPALDRQHHQGDDRGGVPRRTIPTSIAEVVVQRADVRDASTTYLSAATRSRRRTCCTCC